MLTHIPYTQSTPDTRDVKMFHMRSHPGTFTIDIPLQKVDGRDNIDVLISQMAEYKKIKISDSHIRSIYKEGMSIRDMLKTLKNEGKVFNYCLLKSREEITDALMMCGPVIFATPSYDNKPFWSNNGKYDGVATSLMIGWNSAGYLVQHTSPILPSGEVITTMPYTSNIIEAWCAFFI